jgi:tetratricopeptide (TPR) repeat protein
VQAIENPYSAVGFFLGTYYNEVRRPADALRVLDRALGLPQAVPGIAGQLRARLISERATALVAFKRWPDALATYDEGLAIQPLEPNDKARLLRGRGFALSELRRFDEAETSYRDSLAIEPNNQLAMRELTYIAKQRTGAPPAATGQFLPAQQPASATGQKPAN